MQRTTLDTAEIDLPREETNVRPVVRSVSDDE
jgi:hypothetical protein